MIPFSLYTSFFFVQIKLGIIFIQRGLVMQLMKSAIMRADEILAKSKDAATRPDIFMALITAGYKILRIMAKKERKRGGRKRKRVHGIIFLSPVLRAKKKESFVS